MDIHPNRLLVSGLLHSIPGRGWIAAAETVATLTEEQYENVLQAFRLARSGALGTPSLRESAPLPDNVIPFRLRRATK